MQKLKNLLVSYRAYVAEIKLIKLCVLVIINVWLLLIFWKIIALNTLSITNTNVVLLKMNTLLQPLLQLLGLDVLNPNIIKMVVISFIVIMSNLAVLYFSQMIAFLFLGITARYGYKSYNNYINKDILNYYGFEKVQNNLTFSEKESLLNDFIINNAITDEHFIKLIQSKIMNDNFVNKNEFILSISNSWLEYKQKLLSQIIFYQKEQITDIESKMSDILNNKKEASWIESIDWMTVGKIGLLLLAALAAYYGYSYYNNTVKAAKDIGNEAINASESMAKNLENLESAQKNLINMRIDESLQTLINQNDSNFKLFSETYTSVINDQQKNILELQSKIVESSILINQKLLEVQKDSLLNGKAIESLENAKIQLGELSNAVKFSNESVPKLALNLKKVTEETSLLDIKVNGGQIRSTITKDGTVSEVIQEFIPISTLASMTFMTMSTINALLVYHGVPVTLDVESNAMLEKIRLATGREFIHTKIVPRAQIPLGIDPFPSNTDKVDKVDEVDNVNDVD